MSSMAQRNDANTNFASCCVGPVALARYLTLIILCLVFQFAFLGSKLDLKEGHDESDLPSFHIDMMVKVNRTDSCVWTEPTKGEINKHMDWANDHFQFLFRRNSRKRICDERSLVQSAVRYFIYPQELLFSNARYYLNNLVSNELGTDPRILPFRHRYDARFENDIFWSLHNHSLRVDRYQDADLIILAIPFGAIFFDNKLNAEQKNALFTEIWNNLKRQPAFMEGKPHVLVSMTNPLFAFVHIKNVINEGLAAFYRNVQSVSVARGDDHFATRYVYLHNISSSSHHDFRGYDELFSEQRPVTKFTFCVGLGGQAKTIPLAIPTWEKFDNSTYFIFYHTRTTTSVCKSTRFRHAPVINVSLSNLPPSSIGWDLHPTRWAQQYTDSKFCLVIRGDTPHSHAFFNAVKAGCIPVVISDWYPFYSPPLPATLDMRDFCIFVSEEDFIQDPEKALSALQHLPKDVIMNKLKALEWAQRVMIVDHPRSLFVPAFVREAMASFSRPTSEVVRPAENKTIT